MEGLEAMEMTCEKCGGGAMEHLVLPEHRTNRLGISGVVLHNAVLVYQCGECKHIAELTIPNLNGLIAAVALTRIRLPVKLDGEAIRFLRRAVEWTAKELADKLEVQPSTVSRWENNKEPIGPTSEKLLRLLIGLRVAADVPTVAFNPREIESLDISAVRLADREIELPMHLVPRDKRPEDLQEKDWAPDEPPISALG